MKTTISIPDSLFDDAERAAARLGISRDEFFRQALEHFLDVQRSDAIRDRLDLLCRSDSSLSAIDPDILSLQCSSLPEEDW